LGDGNSPQEKGAHNERSSETYSEEKGMIKESTGPSLTRWKKNVVKGRIRGFRGGNSLTSQRDRKRQNEKKRCILTRGEAPDKGKKGTHKMTLGERLAKHVNSLLGRMKDLSHTRVRKGKIREKAREATAPNRNPPARLDRARK